MSAEERQAAVWALRLLESLLALTGCEIKPESRQHMNTLRSMGDRT